MTSPSQARSGKEKHCPRCDSTKAELPVWKEGDNVKFQCMMAAGSVRHYAGVIHKQLSPNCYQVVGFGFYANVNGDALSALATHNP